MKSALFYFNIAVRERERKNERDWSMLHIIEQLTSDIKTTGQKNPSTNLLDNYFLFNVFRISFSRYK